MWWRALQLSRQVRRQGKRGYHESPKISAEYLFLRMECGLQKGDKEKEHNLHLSINDFNDIFALYYRKPSSLFQPSS